MNRIGLVLTFVVCGCKPSLEKECEEVVATWGACLDQALGDQADLLAEAQAEADAFCEQFADVDGEAADAAVELIDCYRSAFDAGTCDSAEGYASIGIELIKCQSPLPF